MNAQSYNHNRNHRLKQKPVRCGFLLFLFGGVTFIDTLVG